MKYYTIGKIINTHGIKGELKIKADTDFNRFDVGSVLYIETPSNLEKVIVNSHRIHQGYDLVTFSGYDDINKVLKFKSCNIKIDEETHIPLEEGEYYFDELIGLDVYNSLENFIGKVIDIYDLPQGEILVVKREGKKNALIPFVDEFIVSVDDKIIINEIEGLL